MLLADALRFTFSSITAHRLRSGLTGLGIAIGITAVVLLTSIGEGIRHYVLTEFTQFGTHLIEINPGKTTTHGTPVGTIATVRPLTLDDAEALKGLSQVRDVVPVVQGNAEAEYQGKRRRTMIYGVGPQMPSVFRLDVASGRFLPADNPRAPRAFAVLGSKVRSELFGSANPLGERIRIANSRFTVIGTMESKGQVLGFDMDDAVYIPAAKGWRCSTATAWWRSTSSTARAPPPMKSPRGSAASSPPATAARITPSPPRSRCWRPWARYSTS